MQLIEYYEVPSDTATVTLSSIPQTFTHLYLLVSARTSRSEVTNTIQVKPNGLGTNATSRYLIAAGTGVLTATSTTHFVWANGNTATADAYGNSSLLIANYTNSAGKSFLMDGVYENNDTPRYMGIVNSYWNDTAAITSLEFDPLEGVFDIKAGSTFSLYGIS